MSLKPPFGHRDLMQDSVINLIVALFWLAQACRFHHRVETADDVVVQRSKRFAVIRADKHSIQNHAKPFGDAPRTCGIH